VSVQSVVVDPLDRLWILDTGSQLLQPTKYGGPKLVCVDLKTDQVVKKILFPQDVALPTTYLNDIRFDLRRGREGMAFITDSAQKGPNGIIVVDLAPGESWRRLNDRPSTKAEELQTFLPIVEGRPFVEQQPDGAVSRLLGWVLMGLRSVLMATICTIAHLVAVTSIALTWTSLQTVRLTTSLLQPQWLMRETKVALRTDLSPTQQAIFTQLTTSTTLSCVDSRAARGKR
jgi:major royal jelly protein